MIIKILIWETIFNSFLHPCTVIDVLSDVGDRRGFINTLPDVWTIDVWDDAVIDSLTTVTVGVGVDMLTDVEVPVLVAVVIDLEFAVSLSYAVYVLADVWVGAAIDAGVLSGARFDFVVDVVIDVLDCVFPDAMMGVNVVAAVMTALECTMSVSLE